MKITKLEAVKHFYSFTEEEAKRFIKLHPELVEDILIRYKAEQALNRLNKHH